MKRKLHILITLLILVVSISLLAWSLLPPRKEIRRQKLEPTQMQLPTPQGYLIPENQQTANGRLVLS